MIYLRLRIAMTILNLANLLASISERIIETEHQRHARRQDDRRS